MVRNKEIKGGKNTTSLVYYCSKSQKKGKKKLPFGHNCAKSLPTFHGLVIFILTQAQSFDISLLFRLTWNKNNNNLIICVPGLWHSVLTSVLNGMHAVYIPYALMKVNPASWMQMITKYRGKHSGYHNNCFRNHGGLQRDK